MIECVNCKGTDRAHKMRKLALVGCRVAIVCQSCFDKEMDKRVDDDRSWSHGISRDVRRQMRIDHDNDLVKEIEAVNHQRQIRHERNLASVRQGKLFDA